MEKNKFEIRSLCADDIFPMCDILGKCGFSQLKGCFEKNENTDSTYNAGVNVIFEIGGVICRNISSCKNELYAFLSDLSGIKPDEIGKLTPSEFARLIKAVISKKEMSDFFTAVSEFFISD